MIQKFELGCEHFDSIFRETTVVPTCVPTCPPSNKMGCLSRGVIVSYYDKRLMGCLKRCRDVRFSLSIPSKTQNPHSIPKQSSKFAKAMQCIRFATAKMACTSSWDKWCSNWRTRHEFRRKRWMRDGKIRWVCVWERDKRQQRKYFLLSLAFSGYYYGAAAATCEAHS